MIPLGCLPVVPREMVERSGWRDTVKRYVDLGAALREGDLTEHVNPHAVKELPLTWGALYKRDWSRLLRADGMLSRSLDFKIKGHDMHPSVHPESLPLAGGAT